MSETPIWRVNAALPGLNVPFFIRADERPIYEQINEVWMRASNVPLKDPDTLGNAPLRECYPSYAGVDLIKIENVS